MTSFPENGQIIDIGLFHETGYYIKRIFNENEAEELATIAIKDTCNMIFRSESTPPDPDLIETTHLFTDYALRKRSLENPKCVWVNGNTRTPKISKSCGIVNQYLNKEIRQKVHFNREIYNVLSTLYDNKNIAYINGYDRFSIKAFKSTDMPKSLNRHLFKNKNNHSILTHIQGVLCGKMPEDVKTKDGGGFEILPYFHHYFKLISVLCDPKTGLLPLKGDIEKEVLPQQLGKEFDILLPQLNNYIYQYTQLYNYFNRNIPAEIDEIDTSVYNIFEKYNIRVPTQWHELNWQIIHLKPGELLAFDTRIPYHNLRNLSQTPSVFFYITLSPIPELFYHSDQHTKLLLSFYEGKMGDWNTSYGNDNIEEYEWRKENDTLFDSISLKDLTIFEKLLLTIEQYTSLSITTPYKYNPTKKSINLTSKNKIFPVNFTSSQLQYGDFNNNYIRPNKSHKSFN